MLMALTSASRKSATQHLDIRFMSRTPRQEYIFTFYKLHKSWREGVSSPRIVFHEYAADEELCVVQTIADLGGAVGARLPYFLQSLAFLQSL